MGDQLSEDKRVLLTVRRLRRQIEELESQQHEPIAIVGIGVRFPGGVSSPEDYWHLVRDGVSIISEVPPSRWDLSSHYAPELAVPGKMYTRHGGFLDDVDRFDPAFFGITPKESVSMDPQQRVLLEVVWEAFERSALPIRSFAGKKVGVYVGLMYAEYFHRQIVDVSRISSHTGSGTLPSTTAGRVSYTFDFHGPSFAVDTACSSSLVALHQACISLRLKESDVALVGGVNMMLDPENTIFACQARMLSPNGRCHTFDARANGYVRGEGCAAVVLRRLSDAIANQDPVYALIRGTAVNQDGKSQGLTAPNGLAQRGVIRDALAAAGIDPGQVVYAEAHGTGTALGDPIEAQALGAAYRGQTPAAGPLIVGSVKTNLGHTEGAAGVAGVIKAALALVRQEIPVHLNLEQTNPLVSLRDSRLKVPVQRRPWPRQAGDFACVSSFGFSGTNAHVILERYTPSHAAESAATPTAAGVLMLAGRTAGSLRALARRYADRLRENVSTPLNDVIDRANAVMADLDHRAAVRVSSREDLHRRLTLLGQGHRLDGVYEGVRDRRSPSRVAFVCCGCMTVDNAQLESLCVRAPAFREQLEACGPALPARLGTSVWDVLRLPASSPARAVAETLVQIALARWLESAGVSQHAALGYSRGVFAASAITGVLAVEDALELAAAYGELLAARERDGAMAAIHASPDEVVALIAGDSADAAVAAVLGPRHVVLGGARSAVQTVVERARTQGLQTVALASDVPLHTKKVKPLADKLARAAAGVSFHDGPLSLVGHDGGPIDGHALAAAAFCRLLRPAESFEQLKRNGVTDFVELGTKGCLRLAGRSVADAEHWIEAGEAGQLGAEQLAVCAGRLHARGLSVQWRLLFGGGNRSVALPTQPFDRQRYWFERPTVAASSTRDADPALPQGMIEQHIDSAAVTVELGTSVPGRLTFLRDHRAWGAVLLPATGFIEMALGAARVRLGLARVELDQLQLQRALLLGEEHELRIVLHHADAKRWAFDVLSRRTKRERWETHASGFIQDAGEASPAGETLASLQSRITTARDVSQFYAAIASGGIEYGEAFRGIEALWTDPSATETFARVRRPSAAGSGDYVAHPAVLDACLQAVLPTLTAPDAPAAIAWLPVAIDNLRIEGPLGNECWVHARARPARADDEGVRRADVRVFGASGDLCVRIDGLRLQAAGRSAVLRASGPRVDDWLFELAWIPQNDLRVRYRTRAPTFAAPADVVTKVDALVPSLVREAGLDTSGTFDRGLDELVAGLVATALQQLGVSTDVGCSIDVDEVALTGGVRSERRALLERLFAHLQAAGVLAREGKSRWRVVRADRLDTSSAARRLSERFPAYSPMVRLVERCGDAMADVLRGKASAIDLLFGEPAVIEAFYHGTPPARLHNALVRESVASLLDGLPRERNLRVLEIGAGTGGTTAHVLPIVPRRQTEYVYTDLSPAFLNKAAERFAGFELVRYQPLDIETDPESQGFAPHQYDIIIAANVLHATVDLRRTLEHTRKLLASGGVLVLLEVTSQPSYLDVTFGLTDGWWRFADRTLRPDYPLLTTARWRDVLGELGFESRWSPPDQTRLTEQTVLIAQGPRLAAEELRFPAPPSEPRSWLILCDAGGVGAALARRLEAAGHTCKLVWHALASADRTVEVVDPLASHDLDGVVGAFARQPASGRLGIIDLWPLDAAPTLDAHVDEVKRAQMLGSAAGLALAQAILRVPFATPPELWLVTRGTQPAGAPAAASSSAQAALWGLGRTLANEYPELDTRRVDLPLSEDQDSLAAMLCHELISVRTVEDEIALRPEGRFVSRLVDCRERVAESNASAGVKLRADHSYLITGGLGGLGLAVAEWMVERGAQHLVLTSRTGKPKDDAGEEVLARLRAAGANVLALAADVTEPSDVQQTLAAAQQLAPLAGIIHSVGVVDDVAVLGQPWERFERVLAPKVYGAWMLHEQTRGRDLDFFILFSSVAALLGTRGQANHSAANAFLDALAHERRRSGLPGLSINWGGWEEIGYAARRTDFADVVKGVGIISVAGGLRALEVAMAGTATQLMVSPMSWDEFWEAKLPDRALPRLTQFRVAAKNREAAPEADLLSRLQTVSAAERSALVRAEVSRVVATILGSSEPIGTRTFEELGVDSLMAIDVREGLGALLKRTLPPTLLFEYPTVDAVAEFILRDIVGRAESRGD